MNKLILVFLLLGVLGFSKDKTVIRDKKISEGKEILLNFQNEYHIRQKLKI